MPASWGCKRRPLRARAALGDQPLVPSVCHNLGLLPWLFLQAAPFSRSLPETQQASKSGAGVFAIPQDSQPLSCKHTIILLGCAPSPGHRLWESVDLGSSSVPLALKQGQIKSLWGSRHSCPVAPLLVLFLWASENQPCPAEDQVPTMTCSGHPWSWGTRPLPRACPSDHFLG